MTTSIVGRKRSRGTFEASYPVHTPRWDSGPRRQPNAVSLDTVFEEDEGGCSIPPTLSNDESDEEKKTLQGRTLVFGKGAKPWYDPVQICFMNLLLIIVQVQVRS